jgi:pimeloyl-ACP methyl ester carboxylesterase
MNTTEFWFESRGTRLFATESGTGTPLILAHGGLANHQSVWLWAGALATSFRLITPDLRASGRSHDPGPLHWAQLADDVAALMRHLGLARAIVGGISFGAGVAVATALRHPAFVDGLVLIHPAFGGTTHGLAPAQVAAMDAMAAAGARTLETGIAALFPLFDGMPAALRERALAVVATYDPASVAALTAFMASGEQPFARGEELAAIDVPVLVVPGIDPQHPREVADVFARHVPACTVRQATDLAAAIGEFARSCGLDRRS